MKIFDLHADLALAIRRYPHETAVLKNHWETYLHQGEIQLSAAASFFKGDETWQDMMDTVTLVKNDIKASGSALVCTKEELMTMTDGVNYLMTIEGMCGIHDNVEEKIQWLYDQGNRIGSLCWNDQNDLATGNNGDPARGLTDAGRSAVRKMNDLHMIVDVSHANEKTFWDLLDVSKLPTIATHSNAKALCGVERNLTNQQIRAIASKGGLIGLNACAHFISDDKEKQDARHLAKHARYMCELAGTDCIAIGFDFGGYYNSQENHDLYMPDQAQNLIAGLKEEGFSETEIEKIAWRNVYDFLLRYM